MERPILAHAEYFVHLHGIDQRLIYAYYDPEHIYASAKENGTLPELLSEVSENLQYLIDTEDKCYLDSKELKWKVEGVFMDFWGDLKEFPFLTFSIKAEFALSPGSHVLSFYTPVTKLEYNISAVWLFPSYIKPIKFTSRMERSWQSNIVHAWANKDSECGGWETLDFEVFQVHSI